MGFRKFVESHLSVFLSQHCSVAPSGLWFLVLGPGETVSQAEKTNLSIRFGEGEAHVSVWKIESVVRLE